MSGLRVNILLLAHERRLSDHIRPEIDPAPCTLRLTSRLLFVILNT